MLDPKASILSLLWCLEMSPEMGTVHGELSQNGPCDHMVRALPASLSSPAFLWPGMGSGAFQRTLSSNLSVLQHHQQGGSVGQQTEGTQVPRTV